MAGWSVQFVVTEPCMNPDGTVQIEPGYMYTPDDHPELWPVSRPVPVYTPPE